MYNIKDRVIFFYDSGYYLGTIKSIRSNIYTIVADDTDIVKVNVKDIKGFAISIIYKSIIQKQNISKYLSRQGLTINYKSLRNNTESYVKELTDQQLGILVTKAKDAYYNSTEPLFEDEVYDIIEDELRLRNPKHPSLKTGAEVKVTKSVKVQLPVPMGSLDKIKPESGAVEDFNDTYGGPFVLSDKLDGQSLELEGTTSGWNMFTRGNGIIGQDVSHLTKFMNLPEPKLGVILRAEFIMPDALFKSIFSEGKNARNSSQGLLTSDKPNIKALRAIKVCAYSVMKPKLKSSDQFKFLKNIGFETPIHRVVDSVSSSYLTKYYESRRKNSKYKIDGIVVTHDDLYKVPKTGNPKYSKAFKMVVDEQIALATVDHIEWNVSRYGYLIPTIILK